MSGSSQCPHLEFAFQVNVARFEDRTTKSADITGKCVTCGKPLIFYGVPIGLSFGHPTIAPDGQELRLPCVVDGEEPDKSGPAFNVLVR